MESDKYICIRETGAQNQVVIVDMATPLAPQRRQITADSALMCPDKKVIALKATTPGTAGDALQVFNLDTKTKLKSHQMPESVEFWKWITPNMLGLVTASSVYHWDIQVRGLPATLDSSSSAHAPHFHRLLRALTHTAAASIRASIWDHACCYHAGLSRLAAGAGRDPAFLQRAHMIKPSPAAAAGLLLCSAAGISRQRNISVRLLLCCC
jgi:hypothetical protein